MTPTDEIPTKLREILAQVLGASEDRIGPGFSAESAPEWTSLNHLMLISQLESEFGVFFTNQEVQQLTSFDRIVVALVGRNQAGG
jgi:acyl carrier protein